MTGPLFITGANGFVGRRLVRRLNDAPFKPVTCLSRQPRYDGRAAGGSAEETVGDTAPATTESAAVCQWVCGDVRDADSYAGHLEGVDTVVHLAALTGKQRPKDHFAVNAEGTRILLQQCRRAGVRRFLHASTIAVKFPDITHYPYAQSKAKAEEAVRTSGLSYTIIRPTIVLGSDSPSWKAFRTLAAGPLTVVFGDGKTLIQPIHVDDLVTCIYCIIQDDEFDNSILDLGGPQTTSMERFLRDVHELHHRRPPTVLHVPLWPTVPCLVAAETVVRGMLPLTAGQLAPFAHDSTIDEHAAYRPRQGSMKPVADILRAIMDETRKPSDDTPTLDRECRVFTSHLIGRQPDEYILTQYRNGHRNTTALETTSTSMFDAAIAGIASRHRLLARLADTYTRIFAPAALVRKKWILLLSVLETSSATHSHFDVPRNTGPLRVTLALLFTGISFLFLLLCSSVAFAPLHAACATGSTIRRRIG